jgi:hypothetical protein
MSEFAEVDWHLPAVALILEHPISGRHCQTSYSGVELQMVVFLGLGTS